MTIIKAPLNSRFFIAVFFVSFTMVISACSDSNNSALSNAQNPTLGLPGADNPNVVAVPAATVEGPIAGTPVLVGTFFDLGALGYTSETDYFVSGTANTYINVNELGSDGKWQVQISEQADYKTRVVVIRPTNPEDFNGTVFVEWLNVSAGFDSPPDWLSSHTELVRSGFAWVGVSAQKVGVDALLDGTAAAIIPGTIIDDRYDSLSHPGDEISYDIFSQVAQAIREPGAVSILGDLSVQRLIAAGESQSASRMTTYINAFAPMHALYDGYLVHSRTQSSAGLQQDGICDDGGIPSPAITRVRDDLGTPVMMIQPETDLFILGSYSSNQKDSEKFRMWELAGTAHADLYTFLINRFDTGTDPSIAAVVENFAPVPGIIDCTIPVNAGPMHFIVNAAIRALNTWIIDGTAPNKAERLEVAGNPPAIVRDEFGNAKGGVRTPYVDTPIATLEGEGQPQPDLSEIGETCELNIDVIDFCFLAGTTRLFDVSTLGSLYADNDAYIEALNASTDVAVGKGFLLPEDAALIKANAVNSNIFER
ncbi:MAG: hypothetical protein ACI9NT_001682 [Bacteroidia bacterium]